MSVPAIAVVSVFQRLSLCDSGAYPNGKVYRQS
jgi:hypothetical protein